MIMREPCLNDFMNKTQQEKFNKLCMNFNKNKTETREYNLLSDKFDCYVSALENYQWQRHNASNI